MIWKRSRNWYRGRLVTSGSVVPGSPADTPATYHGEPYRDRPPLAKLIDKLLHFWLRHWKFLILAVIASASVVATVTRSS